MKGNGVEDGGKEDGEEGGWKETKEVGKGDGEKEEDG